MPGIQLQEPFCQSCAMPMVKKEDFGTNADGSENQDYCRYCFQNGHFYGQESTMEQVIEKSVAAMRQMKMPESLIEEIRKFIPTLKRWNNSGL